MTKETMTIHAALSTLKILESRIQNAITTSTFCASIKNNTNQIAGVSLEKKEEQMKSAYQSIMDMINRRNAIKRGISISNAGTLVTVSGKEYTVAEAIDMKNNGIDHYENLLTVLKQQYLKTQASISKNNEDVEKKADDYVIGILGSKELKTSSAEAENTRNTYIKANTAKLVDPINIDEQINLLTEKIAAFQAEIDSALSVSNATTIIEIEY